MLETPGFDEVFKPNVEAVGADPGLC